MNKFICSLQFIFKPSYWVMNDKYDANWDRRLNELLDKYEFSDITFCTAKLGDNLIWIENIPYATMTPYDNHVPKRYRASRSTISRAIKLLNKAQNKKKQYSKIVRY